MITPPTFDMYRVYAGIQDAGVGEVPLREARDFEIDTDGVAALVVPPTKLVFLCSPNNPTGRSIPIEAVRRICEVAVDQALVVIDEAYHEFAEADDFRTLLSEFDHVVLLRTLSKFVSLAGVRCGALIASAEVIDYLSRVLPPYTFPTPSIEHVLAALADNSLETSLERIDIIKQERKRLTEALAPSPFVEKVYSSDANFVLLRTRDAREFIDLAHRAGILVRGFPGQNELTDCVRVTIGRPEDNDRLIAAVIAATRGAHSDAG